MNRTFLAKSLIQFALLLLLWLILSGHYDFFHISMGILSSVVIVILNWPLRKHFFLEDKALKTSKLVISLSYFRLLYYIPWLIWQIVVASLQVAYAVLSPKIPIDPALIKFTTKLPNLSSKVILGNSITLTPGTITIQIDEDEFLVHSLMDVSYSGIKDGSLPEQVAKLYQKKPGQVVSSIEVIKTTRDL